MGQSINTYHSNKWEVILSNIPSVDKNIKINQDLYNLYIKGVTIPDITLDIIYSNFNRYATINPMDRGNTDLMQLLIEFTVNEDARNYYNFFNLLMSARFGQNDKAATLKSLNINEITVLFKDNQKRVLSNIVFKNCYLTNISSLPLIMGQSTELTFTASFNYEEMNFNFK